MNNIIILNSGNDGLDISGSKVKGNILSIIGAGDKGAKGRVSTCNRHYLARGLHIVAP